MARLRVVWGTFAFAVLLLLPSAILAGDVACGSVYSVDATRITETDGEATVLLDRGRGTDCEATVFWQTSGIAGGRDAATARDGQDFVAASGQIDLEVGQTRARVTIDILDDDAKEGTEAFFVHFDTPDGETLLARVDMADDIPGWITFFPDNDEARDERYEYPFYINVACTVVRTGGDGCSPDGPLLVKVSISGGTADYGIDYEFLPGESNQIVSGQEILVDLIYGSTLTVVFASGDDEVEPDETVLLTLSDPPGEYRLGMKTLTTLTIRDATPPPVGPATLEFARSQYAVWERAGQGAIQVERDGDDAEPASVQVRLRIGDPSDDGFWEDTVTATFGAGDDDATVLVDLPPDDDDPEANVLGLLTLHDPQGATLGEPDAAWLVIADDDGDAPQQEEVPQEVVDAAVPVDDATEDLAPADTEVTEEGAEEGEADTPSLAPLTAIATVGIGAAIAVRRRP